MHVWKLVDHDGRRRQYYCVIIQIKKKTTIFITQNQTNKYTTATIPLMFLIKSIPVNDDCCTTNFPDGNK